MTTEFYKIGSGCDADVLERAGELIRSGELVAFPTETVYGLGANAYLAESARKVYAAKGRPSDNPLIVHVNDSADASLFAETNETYKKLAKQFMPGPLTVILPKKDVIPDEVTGGLRTVAVRCFLYVSFVSSRGSLRRPVPNTSCRTWTGGSPW